jgi:hypothetical protein
MPPFDVAVPNRSASPEAAPFRKYSARVLAAALVGSFYVLLPLLPFIACIAYQRTKYAREYWTTLKKMVIHLQALYEPVRHYLQDVAGGQRSIPAEIQGSCTQCGKCCLDKRCTFLEQTADDKYICGVYHAPLRRYSNCGSFPLDAHDIERYDCPGYTVVREAPIQWMKRENTTPG